MSTRREKFASIGPSWFDLDKYVQQEVLDPPGWLLQIGVRRDLLTYIHGQIENGSKTLSEGIALDLIKLIRHEPILQWNSLMQKFGVDAIQMILPSLAPLHSPQPRNQMGVHPTTVEEVYRSQLGVHPALQHEANQFFAQMHEGIEAECSTLQYLEELDNRVKQRKCLPVSEDQYWSGPKVPYNSLLDQPLYCSSEVIQQNFLLTVNINLPDKLLQAQFKDAIERTRRYLRHAINIGTHLPVNPAVGWSDHQILAFLDLSCVEFVSGGNSLSRSEIATLIWPPTRSGKAQDKGWNEETLKDTTESIAQELMADYSEPFWTLQATVASLLAGQADDLQPPSDIIAALKPPLTRRRRGKNK